MNYNEKMLVKRVYANAFKYVATHLKGFLFLTFFYYLVSLIPISNVYLHLICLYLLVYFAAGLYYKQRILLDTHIFTHATLRFITAIMLFIISMLVSSLGINIFIHMLRTFFPYGNVLLAQLVDSALWIIIKYLFLFFLLIIFFLIPSFAFISEISGKSRSVINAYAKTKNNIHKISIVALIAVILTWLFMAIFAFVTPYIAQLAYTTALVFGTIVYFKMYDFFYSIPQTKRTIKSKATAAEKKDSSSVTPKPEENKSDVD